MMARCARVMVYLTFNPLPQGRRKNAPDLFFVSGAKKFCEEQISSDASENMVPAISSQLSAMKLLREYYNSTRISSDSKRFVSG
jgi:hypothetical protein